MELAAELKQAWTVSALTNAIKNTLEYQFPHVVVQGEISNFKEQSSGHLYFTLKDANAQIALVMFRADAIHLNFSPNNGDKVIVEGSLNVFAQGGRYQINVRKMQKQGLGELLLLLQELKQKILKRGWFKPENKKKLPFLPYRIGVVTSPTGAAIQDILNVLCRRSKSFHLILNPVKVQGEGAAEEIARAINFFNLYLPVDVLIIGRGGGSFEDLFCFNEEIVAEAVHKSLIPIICAVGHEVDHCIAEYVADVRAPTPSAAAEIIMAERVQLTKHLHQIEQQIKKAIWHKIHREKAHLQGILRHSIFRSPYQLLGPWIQKVDNMRQEFDSRMGQKINHNKLMVSHSQRLIMAHNPTIQLKQNRQKLHEKQPAFERAIRTYLSHKRQRLNHLHQLLHAIDPNNLLKKGYSLLLAEKDGSVITSTDSVSIGEKVRIRLAKGSLLATIDQVYSNE